MDIAVLIGGIAYESQRRLLDGITRYAEEADVGIYVFTCNGDNYRQSEYGLGEFQIFRLPDLERYDGIIFAKDTIQNEQFADEIAQRIRNSGIPAVSIESRIQGMPMFCVDNEKAMYGMVSHLIEEHCVKNICYLSGPGQNPESVDRLRGALAAMREHGLILDEADIYYGDYWVESGKRLVKQIMESEKELPEAIVCANDHMALGVYTQLSQYGVQIGKEILLTGFDHISDTENLTPMITTVEKPQEQIGYEACKCLAEGTNAEDRVFEVKYYYGGSCGCPEHKERNLSMIQLENIQQKSEIISMAEANKNLVFDLNDCDNLQDFCECLKSYIAQTGFSYVYLCLCRKDLSAAKTEYAYQIRESYSDKVHIPLAYENGVFAEYPDFACKELLPAECRARMAHQICIVAPIHFRRNCLGYCVICGSGLVFSSIQFQNWLMNISNALDNIYKQSALKSLVSELNNVWKIDHLTQIYNRAGFFHYASGILEECRRDKISIGMLFADINKLKYVNDNFGHEEGDFYIMAVAQQMKKLRTEGQLLMRYGGDEFVVLGKLERGNEFTRLLERLNPELEKRRLECEKRYEMSVSIGFQSVPVTETFQLDQLMKQADREMYEMKQKKGFVRS